MRELKRVVTTLWDFLALAMEPVGSDVLLAFGGPTLCIPQRALELFEGGYGVLIVVTGNAAGTYNDSGWAEPTAAVFGRFLRDHGVPDRALVEVPDSSNTLEDCLFAIRQIEERGLSPSRFIAISRPIHQRRAFATMQRAFRDLTCLSCPCAETHPSGIDDIDTLFSIGKRAVEEIDRLRLYGSRGELEPEAIPDIIDQEYQTMTVLISKRERILGQPIRSFGQAH